jgi:putative transposase
MSLTTSHHVPDIIRDLKANSTKFIRAQFPNYPKFAWQTGSGAFSVGLTSKNRIIQYIENQEDHHKKFTYEEEFLYFLQVHNIPYDKRFVLD